MSTGLHRPRSSMACCRSSRSLQSTAWRNFVNAPGWSVRLQRKRKRRCFSSALNWRFGLRMSSFNRRSSSALGRASRSLTRFRAERASLMSFSTAGCSFEASESTKHLKQRTPAPACSPAGVSGCSSQPAPPSAARLFASASSRRGAARMPVGTSISWPYWVSAKTTGCVNIGKCTLSHGTPDSSSVSSALRAKASSLPSKPGAAAGSQPRACRSAACASRRASSSSGGPVLICASLECSVQSKLVPPAPSTLSSATSCLPCLSTARRLKSGSTPR
mmetsp:Transcript_67364/g.196934  ORF Transcript_67364/g.196934 Transcript_67364/m.196934 type:complete len:276 (-) Transcript_67364:540-1367(-)